MSFHLTHGLPLRLDCSCLSSLCWHQKIQSLCRLHVYPQLTYSTYCYIVSSREQSPRFYTYVYTRKTWRKIKIIVALLVDDTQEDKTITILLTDRFRLNFNVYNYYSFKCFICLVILILWVKTTNVKVYVTNRMNNLKVCNMNYIIFFHESICICLYI